MVVEPFIANLPVATGVVAPVAALVAAAPLRILFL